jgi:DNA-binding transcriptional LysR family regulator
MESLDIRCISEAANTGNLSQAAKALGLDISTVSRRIDRIENSLGVTLFERTRKGMRLTAVGEAVLIQVKRVLIEVNAIAAAAHARASGTIGELRLGVSTPPVGGQARDLLQAWRTAHPEITLTLKPWLQAVTNPTERYVAHGKRPIKSITTAWELMVKEAGLDNRVTSYWNAPRK